MGGTRNICEGRNPEHDVLNVENVVLVKDVLVVLVRIDITVTECNAPFEALTHGRAP